MSASNQFDDILDGKDREIQRMRAKTASQSKELRQKERTINELSRKAVSNDRRVTYSSPVLAVEEPVATSYGHTATVQLAEILDTELYMDLVPLVGPLIEATTRLVQGSDITKPILLRETGDDGRPTSRLMKDKDGKPIRLPSTLDQIKELYQSILEDPEVQESLDLIREKIISFRPNHYEVSDRVKGPLVKYQNLAEQRRGRIQELEKRDPTRLTKADQEPSTQMEP